MMVSKALEHLQKYPAKTLDARSREILRESLVAERKEHERIAGTVKDPSARAEFVAVFASDMRQIEAAIELIDSVEVKA